MVSTTSGILVRGHVEDGWGKVADAFRANFEGNPGEVGAACCVYVGGRPVVDLWGGLADREANRPWDSEPREVRSGDEELAKGIVQVRTAEPLPQTDWMLIRW